MKHLVSFALACASLAFATNLRAAPTAQVQIGVCAGPARLQAAKLAGFDYVELAVRELAALSEAEFAKVKASHSEIGLPTPVANLFLPGHLKVTGAAVDLPKQASYLATALDRAAALGVRIIVFGSGAARDVPDGFSPDEGWNQLVDFGKRAARAAAKRRITLAVEPLRSQESNIVNTAAEGLRLVKAIGHPNFQLMVDLYHLSGENEDAAIIVKSAPHVRHFHIANPNGRRYPMDAAEYAYGPFFDAIRAIKYRGGISVEGSTDNFDADAVKSIAFLREAVRLTKTTRPSNPHRGAWPP